jgi:hypothetical protein
MAGRCGRQRTINVTPMTLQDHRLNPARSVAERDALRKEVQIMLCYSCAEQGIHQSAIALCRGCSAGLCREHLRETASRLASGDMLDGCHHDTWTVMKHPLRASERSAEEAAG